MDNFKGILLYRTADNKPFPQQYIEMGSWSSNPDQREEIRAYRDDNTRALTRITAQGRKSIFSFATRNNLHLKDKIAIQKWFTEKEVNSTERKIQLTFWNEETNNYDTGYFYRPNMEFKINKRSLFKNLFDQKKDCYKFLIL